MKLHISTPIFATATCRSIFQDNSRIRSLDFGWNTAGMRIGIAFPTRSRPQVAWSAWCYLLQFDQSYQQAGYLQDAAH